MKRFLHILFLALLVGSSPLPAWAAGQPDNTNTTKQTKEPSKGAVFFCKVAQKIDNFQLNGLDTNYITLPEYSWRVAMTTGGTGINSTYTT